MENAALEGKTTLLSSSFPCQAGLYFLVRQIHSGLDSKFWLTSLINYMLMEWS